MVLPATGVADVPKEGKKPTPTRIQSVIKNTEYNKQTAPSKSEKRNERQASNIPASNELIGVTGAGTGPFKCNTCNKNFATAKILRTHFETICGAKKVGQNTCGVLTPMAPPSTPMRTDPGTGKLPPPRTPTNRYTKH